MKKKTFIKVPKPKIRKKTAKPGDKFDPEKGGSYKRKKKIDETDH